MLIIISESNLNGSLENRKSLQTIIAIYWITMAGSKPSGDFLVRSFWGPHSIDRFVNPVTAQLQWLNSRFWLREQRLLMYLLVVGLRREQLMISTCLLYSRVFRHAQISEAKGTLASPFCYLLYPNSNDPTNFITSWPELPSSDECLVIQVSDFIQWLL